MPINIPHGKSDAVIEKISETLRAYETDHPLAEIALYRQNSVSVRVRIIDPDFRGQDRVERSEIAWEYLDRLPDEAHADISTLILLTPEETATSFSNMNFEDPIPSDL